MERLIRSGLMFGNMVHVASPALVARYNRALEHLTGKTTQLTDFYIDISGFSPEIGHELDDPLYLNHAGVNRQFILLTTAQKDAPLLNSQFSTSHGILRQFIDENESALFALTARDAVAGELLNSVYIMDEPQRLFDIRRVHVEADTVGGALRQADALDEKVNRFLNEEDAWFDDVLIAEMITLAGETGDVVRNPITLKQMSFDQQNFWTAHFGGTYLFQEVEHPALITGGIPAEFGRLPIKYVFHIEQRNQIAKFLEFNGLAEPIAKARGVDAGAILRQKMDFILVDELAGRGIPLAGRSRADMRRLARQHAQDLPEEFHVLAALVNWAENGGPWPRIASDSPAYFYTLRAANHPDADLVNMLLSHLSPKDIRQLFICHKPLFYDRYATWSDEKRDYVVEFLVNDYQMDKVGTRKALFGHEPPRQAQDRIEQVGPWGAVRR